ncbi:MAG: DNA topoisomerase (ATP-hydrolyzing) subunit B [Christensenellaceae bacterium]|nr:DNA topoisomerase (ATP-hydrolyzing) subunit B [Christensenellaceae bacterium]
MSKTKHEYGSDEIQVLEGLDPVRKRPGMYIGSTDERGLHHLIVEIVDNSVDEALAGYCDTIDVEILRDGSVSVQDNGRGIPTGMHKTEKKSAVEVVLTKLHAGGKFGGGGYKISGGLHGVGLSVVNALAEWLDVEIWQNGKTYKQSYNRGIPQRALAEGASTTKRGTKITFFPDADIFNSTDFNYETIRARLREVAFLNKGLTINCSDARPGRERKDSFCYKGGIVEFVEHLNRNKTLIFPQTIYVSKQNKNNEVEIAFAYNDGYSDNIHSYANNINTEEGGVHVIGFRNALMKVVNDYGKKANLIKESDKLTIDDVLEGITAIISVKLTDPQFEGQTKTKLGNSEMRGEVEKAMTEAFGEFLEEHPKEGKDLINKCVMARNARDAARKARELVQRKGALESTTLPGKLADCRDKENPQMCEIYIVEGESAGGTAKVGRNSMFQAILPLRGKILNVEKVRDNRVLENQEIKNMITAFGCGFKETFDESKLRYGKIISMTDADVDGSHIRILLLTFLYRFMRPLIEHGHVYAATPPLYKVSRGGKDAYYYSDAELEEAIGKNRNGYTVQRYKGLGEMNAEQLWDTTMNPANRTLQQITMEDAFAADEIFTTLMGEKPELRRNFIAEHARDYTENLDI